MSTTQIVERARAGAAEGKSVLVLFTSRMQADALREALPESVQLAKRPPAGKRFDLVLDDR